MMNLRELIRSIALGTAAAALLPSQDVRSTPLRPAAANVPDLEEALRTQVWACWIGHATVLLRIGNKWVLTDPVLFDSYGPSILGMTVGPRRIIGPALTLEEIPKPDLVLISHAHLDHMDRTTLFEMSERYPNEIDVITAARTMDVIDDLPWRSLNEMDWGDSAAMHGFDLHALKVKHNGWRWPGDACRANGQPRTGRSFNGYYIRYEGVGIVFGGDTAFTREFEKVPGNVDLAIMPIGAYDPYPETHCTPEESLAMVEMMKAPNMMPIHHSTFRQSEEPIAEPMQRLNAALVRTQTTQLAAEHAGEHITLIT